MWSGHVGRWSATVYLNPMVKFLGHIFLKACYLGNIYQYVHLLVMAALPSNSLLHLLPHQTYNTIWNY